MLRVGGGQVRWLGLAALIAAAALASPQVLVAQPSAAPAPAGSEPCGSLKAEPSPTAAELVNQGSRLQAGACGHRDFLGAERLFRRAISASGGAEHQAWALRSLADLRAAQGGGWVEVEQLLAEQRARSGHYAWLHAEAWIRFRQGRYAEAASILELLVSGRLHHTAWPWAMFYDDLGDSYAALGRDSDARVQWRRALQASAVPSKMANPEGLPWDRGAVVSKLSERPRPRR